MTSRTKNIAIIAGFALLAILAVAGWTRTPNAGTVGANNFASPNGVYMANPTAPAQPTYGYAPNQQPPAYATQAPVQSAAYAPGAYQNNCVDPAYTNAAYAPAGYYNDTAPRYRSNNRPRVVRTRYVENRDVVTRSRRGRSTGKSVAIVGGSAGVGAAIGARAGGGKGAAIGALTGGAGGFIYDRLTHNR